MHVQTLTLETFPQASFTLQGLLDQFKEDVSALERSSSDFFSNFKERVFHSWQSCAHTISIYKDSLKKMPKELRQRDVIKQTLLRIEGFEEEIQKFLSEMETISFQDFRVNLYRYVKDADMSLRTLPTKIRELAGEIGALENHDLVQKFLRGETILSSPKRIQWGRKGGHAVLGLLFFYLFIYSGLSSPVLWSISGVFLVWAFSLEIMRHRNPKVNEWVCRKFRPIMREAEKKRVCSAIFYMVSMLIVYFSFPIEVSMLCLLFLAVGDSLAGIVGVYWGKRKLTANVSLEGFLTCFLVCSALSALCAAFLFSQTLSGFWILAFALPSGFIGALSEALFEKIDDNLTIPLISAPFLWLLMQAFGIL